MTRQEKAVRIAQILEELYPTPPIPLNHTNAFTLLIAVLLSAQTTDAQVNKISGALFENADNPLKMSARSEAEILSFIKSCGLAPGKAKAIAKLSKILLNEHDGEVPEDFESLEALPGVGHKTASVVMTQWFGHPAFPVDTHIHRLASRWGLSRGKSVEHTERDLKKLFPPSSWGKLHLQIIYFGREYCPARHHDLSQCQICSWAATKKRIQEEADARGRPANKSRLKTRSKPKPSAETNKKRSAKPSQQSSSS